MNHQNSIIAPSNYVYGWMDERLDGWMDGQYGWLDGQYI